MEVPSSAYVHPPSNATKPATTHAIMHTPKLCPLNSTKPGDAKMAEVK